MKTAAQQVATTARASHHLRTALDYLLLWVEVHQYLREHELQPLRYIDLLTGGSHLSGLGTRLQACRPYLSTDHGLLMLQGMFAGLSDREDAVGLFRKAKEENADFAMRQPFGRFIHTYLSESEVLAESDAIVSRRTKLIESFEVLEGDLPTEESSTLFLFSCDPIFFAAFFPFWASAATYLRDRDVHLHFVLVGDGQEVATKVEQGLALAADTARLRGLSPDALLRNLSFSRVETPSGAGELRTVYACVRFLVARELAKRTPGPMLVLDIDMEVDADPGDALEAAHQLAPAELPLVITPGLMTLVPAHRLPAARVLLPGDGLIEPVMRDMENYIYAGLSEPRSWLLDQNALDYATGRMIAAKGLSSIVDIGDCMASFRQKPIGQLYKQRQPPHA